MAEVAGDEISLVGAGRPGVGVVVAGDGATEAGIEDRAGSVFDSSLSVVLH